MSAADNKSLVERFWHCVYVERDYEQVGRYFHADGVYEDVPIPQAKGVGPRGIARRLALGHEPVEAFEHEVLCMLAEDERVITEHVETWRFHTGEVIALPFCSVHVVQGDKFALWRDYSNMATVLENAPAWWIEHISKAKPEDFLS